jgi:hypothetical protein
VSFAADYVQAVRDVSGYWGSSPLSRVVRPGTLGTIENGIFMPDDDLRNLSEFADGILQTTEQAPADAADVYMGAHVSWVAVGAAGAAPVAGIPVGARVNVRFAGSRQVIVACNGSRTEEFDRLSLVKARVRETAARGGWQKPWAFVTDVIVADSARAVFSSSKGGTASIAVKAGIPGLVSDRSIFAAPGLDIGGGSEYHGVIAAEVGLRCTPLFHALQFRRWHHVPGTLELRLLGTDDDFEEPQLGLPAASSSREPDPA